ncbi:MAG TPA: response regulator [Polyangiales bacterium]|nr:response regulator [Polyangiales bacterium]
MDHAAGSSILIVDDTVENLQLMASILTRQGYETRPVPSGKLALQAIYSDPPDLVLLDIHMPGMNGYEVCERLKRDAKTRDIPVIFISALDDLVDKVRAFAAGGCDFVSKPFQHEEVLARVRAQLELRRQHRELEASYVKLQELEQLRDSLVHMIVHDMRSPLCVVLGNSACLRDVLAGRVEAAESELLSQLMAASRRIQNMADSLLDVSRLEAGRMPLSVATCDLSDILERVVVSVRPLDPERALDIDAPASLPVTCDEQLVFRVLENLINNAMKHTPRPRPIHVSAARQPDSIRVAVRDEGPGIPELHQRRIFEKFGSLDGRVYGRSRSVGLGLAFCKLAIEAHGGRIGVVNERNVGCSFWFTLPLPSVS